MSFIYPHWDQNYQLLDVTPNSFSYTEYYKDRECKEGSSKHLGRYQKTITVLINENKVPPEKRILHPYNLKNRGYGFKDIWPNCEYYIEHGYVKILSEEVNKNPDYDPEFWQQEYDSMAEAIRLSEKEGYHIF